MVAFHPNEKAHEAAQAFERYDLVSAAVVNAEDKLMGRVTVNAVMDFIREESASEALNLGGLAPGRGFVRADMEEPEEPVDLAGYQSGHRVYCVPRHRHIRGFNRKTGRAGGIDADHCRNRRQFRQPDHYDDRARAGVGAAQCGERAQAARQGNGRERGKWSGMGQYRGIIRIFYLPQCFPGSGDDFGNAVEFAVGGNTGCADTAYSS